MVVAAGDAEALLGVMRAHPLGREAAVIGVVTATRMASSRSRRDFGGRPHPLEWLAAEQSPVIRAAWSSSRKRHRRAARRGATLTRGAAPASSPRPGRRSGRQRNFSSAGSGTPSVAFAMASPSTGANLKPCPEPPAATVRPSLLGSRAIPEMLVPRVAVDADPRLHDWRVQLGRRRGGTPCSASTCSAETTRSGAASRSPSARSTWPGNTGFPTP